MQIVREFSKRNEGKIGQIVLESDVSTIKLNGKPIPVSSIEYLMNFALQSLQDSYAGAKNLDECKAFFEKKLDAIQNGTLGMRSGGGNSAVSDEIRIGRQIVQALYKKQVSKEAYKAWLTNDDEEKIKFLDGLLAKNAEKITPLVVEELKRLAAKKNELAGISFEL